MDQKITTENEKLTCGIIMPIASMGSEYPESHWIDIRSIINRAIEKAGFIPRIVSESDDATLIQKCVPKYMDIKNNKMIRWQHFTQN